MGHDIVESECDAANGNTASAVTVMWTVPAPKGEADTAPSTLCSTMTTTEALEPLLVVLVDEAPSALPVTELENGAGFMLTLTPPSYTTLDCACPG